MAPPVAIDQIFALLQRQKPGPRAAPVGDRAAGVRATAPVVTVKSIRGSAGIEIKACAVDQDIDRNVDAYRS